MITHKKTITTLALAALMAAALPAHAFFSLRDAVNSFKKSTLAQVVAGGCALGLGAYLIYKWKYETPKVNPAVPHNHKPQDPTNTPSSSSDSSTLISSPVPAISSSSSSSSSSLSSSSFSSSNSAATLSSATAIHTPTIQLGETQKHPQQKTLVELYKSNNIVIIPDFSSRLAPDSSFDSKVNTESQVGGASHKGIVADEPDHENEDFVILQNTVGIYGICDGNGKTKAAVKNVGEGATLRELAASMQCQEHEVDTILSTQLEPRGVAENVGKAITRKLSAKAAQAEDGTISKKLFLETNQELLPKCNRLGSGSTAVFAVVNNKTLKIINLGDSQAVLFSNGKGNKLSQDSKSSFNFGSDVFNENKVHTVTRQINHNDEFLVLMSDGVSNILDYQTLYAIIKSVFDNQKNANIAAQKVLEEVRKRTLKEKQEQEKQGKTCKIDDASIIIVRLNT